MSLWLHSGLLSDPFAEFFVELNPLLPASLTSPASGDGLGDGGFGGVDIGAADVDNDTGDEWRVWEGKFRFKGGMLPSFLGEDFGRKVRSLPSSILHVAGH